MNQMKQIYFVKDDLTKEERKEINYNFNRTNNELTFPNNNISITEISQYHIEIINDIKTLYYYIHYIKIPDKIISTSISSLILNKNNNYLDIKAPTYFQNIITKIISESNNQFFSIYYCRFEQCRIGLEINQSNILSSSLYLLIKFYIENNKELPCKLGIIFYPKNSLEEFFPINNNDIYQTYKSDDEGDDTYITLIPYNSLSDRINTLANLGAYKTLFPHTLYNYYNIDLSSNSLYFFYNIYGKNDNHSLVIRDPSNINKFINSKINFISCDKQGEIYTIKNSKVTCSSCSNYNSLTPYKAAESNKCVENCGNNYLFKRHNSCYLDCQSIKTTRTVFIQEETKECVFECSKGFGRYYESSINCYNCSINNKVAKDGFCIDCGGDQNCMNLGNYIFEDTTASNCDNYDCQNNGNCFIKNNEAYCNCTENYYGLKCELGLDNAINITNDLIDDFLTPKSSFKDEEKYKSYEDKNGDICYLLDDEDIIKQIREISILIKNPKIVEDIYKSSDKINKLMNVCVNMINKMIDGIIELNANILEFFDLATNLVSSKIQISSLRRLRNLQDENNGEININLEEEKKKNK